MSPTKDLPPLGFISVEVGFLRPPGDPKNPRTWPFPLIHRTAKGSNVGELVSKDAYSEAFIDQFVEAGQWLADQGAIGIITSCGFLAMAQPELAARLPIPIATSSLIQIPSIRAFLPAGKIVGVLTFDDAQLGPLHFRRLGISDPENVPIGGPRAGGHLQSLCRKGGPYSQKGIEDELVEAARNLVEKHPSIGAIVLECTQMPPYGPSIREAVGLPIYDTVTMGKWFYSGLVKEVFTPWSDIEKTSVDKVFSR